MKLRHALVVLLAGCASNPYPEGPATFDAGSREPLCARQCTESYSVCVSGARGTDNRVQANDILRTCQANTRQCLQTCPRR